MEISIMQITNLRHLIDFSSMLGYCYCNLKILELQNPNEEIQMNIGESHYYLDRQYKNDK